MDEITGFLRQVRVPDEHELREADVSPENREREHERAEIVEMVLIHDAGQRAVALEQNRHDCRKREDRVKQPGEKIDSEHRRKPMRIQRHELVEGGHRETDSENEEKRRGKNTIL